jgi:hypothetical protein
VAVVSVAAAVVSVAAAVVSVAAAVVSVAAAVVSVAAAVVSVSLTTPEKDPVPLFLLASEFYHNAIEGILPSFLILKIQKALNSVN